MTVKELIEHLGTFDPSLPIVYSCCSEYTTLDAEDIVVAKLHRKRADGWVHSYDKNQKTVEYLVFPGN